jgi:HK97 family phage major capsid protein
LTDQQIISERTRLQGEADAIVNNPNATRTELKRVDVILSKIKNLRTNEEFAEHMFALGDEVGLPRRAAYKEPSQRAKEEAEIRHFLLTGESAPERRGLVITSGSKQEKRGTALNITTGSQGGFFVPNDFYMADQVAMAMAAYDPVWDDASVTRIVRQNATPLPVPSFDVTSISASIIAENALVSPSTLPTFAQKNLSAPSYNFRSNWVPVSNELVADSAYDVIGRILVPAFAQAIARGASAFMTTGTGSGQPQGILTGASASGVTTASPTAITATELETFYMSLDRAYRTSPNCAWLMSDATYLLIRKLTDTTNLRPLIDIVAGESFLFGKRVLTSPSMPAATATNKPILFGDLSAFYVATTEMQIQVLKERNAEFGQIVVGAGMRIDSGVVSPGSAKPLIYLTMHA